MKYLLAFLLIAGAAQAVSAAVVDGKVSAQEYTNSKSVLSGNATLHWAWDAKGGLTIALEAKTGGWLSVGLGTRSMTGSYMYMGYIDAKGRAVISEQVGAEHIHSPSGTKRADKSALKRGGGVEVLEFHVPVANVPGKGKTVPFIVAFSEKADLVSPHGDNYDIGSIPRP